MLFDTKTDFVKVRKNYVIDGGHASPPCPSLPAVWFEINGLDDGDELSFWTTPKDKSIIVIKAKKRE